LFSSAGPSRLKNVYIKDKIIGTSYDSLADITTEDRGRFSDMLKDLDIPYPLITGTTEGVDGNNSSETNKVGYPVRLLYVFWVGRMQIV
jgi:carbamoyl-phosphate synthase large subunit